MNYTEHSPRSVSDIPMLRDNFDYDRRVLQRTADETTHNSGMDHLGMLCEPLGGGC